MGDSDAEDYDRRKREKFPRERIDFEDRRRPDDRSYGNRSGGYPPRGAPPPPPPDRGDYGQNKRPYPEPPRGDDQPKRPRRGGADWGDDVYDPQPRRDAPPMPAPTSAPILMTFKQFLATQDDSITDEQAIQKYQDYKLEHKRQELHSFFIAHKEEEWFRLKYHPEESTRRNEEHLTNIKRRSEIFNELSEKGWIEKAALDHTNGRHLIRLMDALVVKLEGGSDEDVASLETVELADDEAGLDQSKASADETPSAAAAAAVAALAESEAVVDAEKNGTADSEDGDELSGEVDVGEPKDAANAEDGALSDSGSEHGSAGGGARAKSPAGVDERRVSRQQPPLTPTTLDRKPMLLHKTSSIFLRNLSPEITLAEVESVCKRFPGFLRVGLADPLPERRFYRRGWISFRRDVNIKEICWNFNSLRIRDCDLGAIVNRDLTRRVRTVNGITAHKQVAQSDLRLAARLVQIYDKKAKLWMSDAQTDAADETKTAQFTECELHSDNPLLQNITDYIVEEASAEEEELLGTMSAAADGDAKLIFDRDANVLKVLDRVVLYLRLVHSVDYYNHGEYPHEDEMPNRCGLIHVRGPAPSASQWGTDAETGAVLVSAQFVNEFARTFEARLKPMLALDDQLPDDDAAKLGKKDAEKEVEAYITANTQELAKDKWLCPLSGKKFKGPEFVRKHILTKHNEKLDEVRTEVTYFNNFLYDSRRPASVDMAAMAQRPPSLMHHQQGGPPPHGYPPPPPPFDPYERGPPPPPPFDHRGGWQDRGYGQQRGYGNRSGYGRNYQPRDNYQQRGPPRPYRGFEGRRDPREPITYKDLDAPEDVY